MAGGAFSETARAAIYESHSGRCVGCGSSQVTAQHRNARGMGGTTLAETAAAANGIPLDGSGTTGCHGWAEANPRLANLLGWRLLPGEHWSAPFWTRFGWQAWDVEDGFPFIVYVDPDLDLDNRAERAAAVAEFGSHLSTRGLR